MKYTKAMGISVSVYKSDLKNSEFYNSKLVNDFDEFICGADVIIANRNTGSLSDLAGMVSTRNLFGSD